MERFSGCPRGVAVLRWIFAGSSLDLRWTFADHVLRLNACEDEASKPERPEPHHGTVATFGRPMNRLDNIVQILDLPNGDGRFGLSVDGPRRPTESAPLLSIVTASGASLRSMTFSNWR
ncbi:hypothetical protein [Pandoraea sp.]|uniref:hypothetical protein n=1 Tax=Pandoraea sp. TaxID=1883445 RepID=UPI0035AD8015